MNNFKKIGMTALAASLVSVSAHAGSLSVSGSASINAEGYSGENLNGGTTFSMGNAITFSGGGELDNGMTVSVSYELDQGSRSSAAQTSVWDNHSVTVSSDSMGTLVFSGHGGSTAASSVGNAGGDIWDTFDGARGAVTAIAQSTAGAGNDSFFYTLPSVMDGVSIFANYVPQGASGLGGATGVGASYTGVDGLTITAAMSDIEGASSADSGDQTAWLASYALGPITVAAGRSEYDVGTANSDETTSSMSLSYTISDEMSVTYATNTLDSANSSETDAEYTALTASYTAGGMTISASMKEGDNTDHSTNTNADFEYWSLGASFAF
jgi:outer membrane protein OmpU